MLSRLCRCSFWLAALAAALALLAPRHLGPWLTGLACGATLLAWALWRAGLAVARREPIPVADLAVESLGAPALLDIAVRIVHAVEAAASFDAALLEVGRVLKGELGLHDVRALRVESVHPDAAELAELIDGRAAFCAAARRVRLDPSSTLGRALLSGEVAVGPAGGAVLPVRVGDRIVAVLELGAPTLPLASAALAGLLALAQGPLSRRGSHPAPCVQARAAPTPRSAVALHDNRGMPSSPASAMPTPSAPTPSISAPPGACAQRAGVRLDPAALARLAELDPKGDNQLVRRVLNAFVTSAARLMPQFEAACLGPDLSAVRYVAHTLKSSSASIGALALAATCAEIENQIRAADTAGLAPRLQAMRGQVAAVLVEIDSMLGEQA